MHISRGRTDKIIHIQKRPDQTCHTLQRLAACRIRSVNCSESKPYPQARAPDREGLSGARERVRVTRRRAKGGMFPKKPWEKFLICLHNWYTISSREL